jgi:FtsZ-interacting cell division protein ZipA
MSDLQLALLVLGAIIIFAVVAFNWWQERKLRNEAARHFETPDSDVLMDEEFQFDPEAILSEESQDLSKLAADDFDALSFDEERRPADVQQDAVLNEQTYEEFEAAVAMAAQPAEPEFTEASKVVPEEFESAAASDNEPPKFYEEHVWQSDTLDVQPSLADQEALEQAELIREAGFDEPPSSVALPAQAAAPSVGTARDVVTLSPDIDSRVDLIAVLYLPQAVTGDKVREFLMTVTDIDKPKFLHGLDAEGAWRLITPEQDAASFSKVTCAVQLADRSGFISRNALNRFQHEVDRIGHKLNAQIEWQSNGDPWQQASELDQFCIDVDKMVGFHLVQGGNGPFTGTKFRGLAEANGLTLGADGGFHSENDSGLCLFSVVNRENYPFSQEMLRTSVIHGVTFQLDIPRVRNCSEVFNQMVLTARQMESSLGATLVDDNQRPLGEMQIEKIRQQLKVIHAKMVARGIIPGSASALRLFS